MVQRITNPDNNIEEQDDATRRRNGDCITRPLSPTSIIRDYRPQSQRAPQNDFISIQPSLNNPSWTLIEYYFKEVAALFSSYDSPMNPFRSTISRLWGSSLAICRTMQSMAAATLVHDFPQFGPVGVKMRSEALEIITHEAVMDDKALLALLMLGQTASWHNPHDLGVSFFNLLRERLSNAITSSSSSSSSSNDFPTGNTLGRSNNFRFFEEALIYWEMLLSFVVDDSEGARGKQGTHLATTTTTTSEAGESAILQKVPHPWTGIARDTQSMVQEVGRLVRRERKRMRRRTFTSHADIVRAQKAISEAQSLEERLLDIAHPSEAEIVSPGDDETPVWHLLTIAEVYRCTGLLQLYRTFPDLFHRRYPLHPNKNKNKTNKKRKRNDNEGTIIGKNHTSNRSQLDDPYSFPFLNMSMDNDATQEELDILDLVENNNNNNNNQRFSEQQEDYDNDNDKNNEDEEEEEDDDDDNSTIKNTRFHTSLTKFTLKTLYQLKTISFESRTRAVQPFLLTSLSSDLRLPFHHNQQIPDAGAVEVSRARKFLLGRLASLKYVLPPKPLDVCLKIVRGCWARMDSGEESVYWVDVMMENGWETTMG